MIDDISELIDRMPYAMRNAIEDYDTIVDISMDLGRELRVNDGTTSHFTKYIITQDDLNYITSQLRGFNSRDRAALDGSLHRISCIKNAIGDIIGLTCRVGRTIPGKADIIRDMLEGGKSILVVGKPGMGKTTLLRDAAKILSDELGKRTIVVDSTNEIAGDGDIPHPAIGTARRMQIPKGYKQYEVMISAVENHTPECIVIDEIGHSQDVSAARTIAERGVQLVGTAHGSTLANIIDNPMLTDLVGGFQAVVIGDQAAQSKGTKKTILERKHNPTFDVVVEIIDLTTVAIHHDVEGAIDTILSGSTPLPEIRKSTAQGISISRPVPIEVINENYEEEDDGEPFHIYIFGLNIDKVYDAINNLDLDAVIVDAASQADIILVLEKRIKTVKNYKKRCIVASVQNNTYLKIYESLKTAVQNS